MLAASLGFFWAMAETGKVNSASRRKRVFIVVMVNTPAESEDSRSSTISGIVRVALSTSNPIPLTLTLSHGEREQSAAGPVIREVRREDTALGCAKRQRRILPLPEREGRGEGEGDARCANSVGTSPEICRLAEGPYSFESFILPCFRLCRKPLTTGGECSSDLVSREIISSSANWPRQAPCSRR